MPASRAQAHVPVAGPDQDSPRRIRVLFVIGTLHLGGAEHQLVELAGHLGERFEASVCCLASAGPLEASLREAGVPVTVIGLKGVRGAGGLAALAAVARVPSGLWRFVRHVRRVQPDIVQAFLFHAYVLSAVVARLNRVPVVIAGRRSLSNFKAKRPLYRAAERLANRWTDLMVANSEAVRQDAMTTEGLPPERVVVIHNGVDPARYAVTATSQRERLAPGPGPVVLVVANLIPYKGHRFFLDAWATVCRELPNATALLAGDGPARADCEAQVARLGLQQRVRLLGGRRDVPDLLAACDVLVHPSLEEGFCNALLEAMAAGRPVIATRVGGNPEAVQDGVTGRLVPPSDADALADAMLDVLRRPDRGRALGEAGRGVVHARFRRSTMVGHYETTYDDLLRRAMNR